MCFNASYGNVFVPTDPVELWCSDNDTRRF